LKIHFNPCLPLKKTVPTIYGNQLYSEFSVLIGIKYYTPYSKLPKLSCKTLEDRFYFDYLDAIAKRGLILLLFVDLVCNDSNDTTRMTVSSLHNSLEPLHTYLIWVINSVNVNYKMSKVWFKKLWKYDFKQNPDIPKAELIFSIIKWSPQHIQW
jgi:hypothetical protein